MEMTHFIERIEATAKVRAAQEKEFNDRKSWYKPTDSISHPTGVQKGDIVVVYNSNGILVGPHKVLGFTEWKGEDKMYLDWDCYWYPISPSRIAEIIKKGGEK